MCDFKNLTKIPKGTANKKQFLPAGSFHWSELVQTSSEDFKAASRQSVIVVGGCYRMCQSFSLMNSSVKYIIASEKSVLFEKSKVVLLEKLNILKFYIKEASTR